MIDIKVLGPGCSNCEKVEQIARRAAANMGMEARITKVTDRQVMQGYGLLATPGLVINEKLVCGGRIPGDSEVMTWLADAMMAAAKP